MTALDSGMKIRHKVCQALAPSILALSINSPGIFMKNERITTKLKAPNMPGRISDHRESSSPSCRIMRKDGMRPGANKSVNNTASTTGRPKRTDRLGGYAMVMVADRDGKV